MLCDVKEVDLIVSFIWGHFVFHVDLKTEMDSAFHRTKFTMVFITC